MCIGTIYVQPGVIIDLGRQDDPDLVQSGSCT